MARVVQTYEVEKDSGTVVYTHSVAVNGEQLYAQHRVTLHEECLGRGIPVAHIDGELRRKIMRLIEQRLYGVTR